MNNKSEKIQEVIQQEIYPGYPVQRLVLPDLSEGTAVPELLDGPWTMNNDPLPSPEEAERFVSEGYEVDHLGRPLHPDLRNMLTNPDVGVVTGKGRYWNWGPNRTADPVVIVPGVRRQILLIQRKDTGIWALPGGFVDEGENPIESARRELHEEAGVIIDTPGTLLYQGPVNDLRTTAHAWPETSAYAFVIDTAVEIRAAENETTDARWFYEDELPMSLYGSHESLIHLALDEAPQASIRDILAQSPDQLNVTTLNAGHMAYDHLLISDGSNTLFVKSHDARYFDDPVREAHSRAYLEKEYALYDHLAEEGFTHIPARVDLIDSTMLALDALSESDGWHWRAPRDTRLSSYIDDVLTMLDSLQATVPIHAPAYHDAISQTYETFLREGWESISAETLLRIKERIASLSSSWSDKQKHLAQRLTTSLPELRTRYDAMEPLELTSLAHHDSRQSNIAWHPELGAKLVDWSWADMGPSNADATMILIDLAKSGHDVVDYMDYFNPEYAHILIGFWLSHSLWETRDGSDNVRKHQVASAAVALELILKSKID